MPIVNMTDRFIRTLKPTGQPVEWFDESTRGLSLKISPGGSQRFYYNYTRRSDGLRRRYQLGPAAALPLKDARGRALKLAASVANGFDPAGDRRAERDALGVAELAERYLTEYAEREKRSAKRDRQAIEKDVLPVIGRYKAAAVTRRDIARITERMVGRGVTIGASRTFEIVRKMFAWSVAQGLIELNPCVGMQKPFPTRQRDRVLCEDEIRALWSALPSSHMCLNAQRVLQLCLLTAQRLGEVAGMERSELDMPAARWVIPAARSKNGHAHVVPLTDDAMALIQGALRDAAGDFLFGGYGDGPLLASSVGKGVRRSQKAIGVPHWTAHDLRRTAATFMAQLGVAPHVIGHVLNHRSVTKASVTDQVYVRYSYDAEKRAALELWNAKLFATLQGREAVVVPMKSAWS